MKSTSFCLVCVFIVISEAVVINSSILSGKIVNGGKVTTQSEVLFMASIRLRLKLNNDNEWIHICGGCMISEEHILSAAQCVYQIRYYARADLENAAAFMGSISLIESKLYYRIKKTIVPNEYNPENVAETIGYNIGIMWLSSRILIWHELKRAFLFDGDDIQSGMTMGWGSVKHSRAPDVFQAKIKQMPAGLMEINITTISKTSCQQKLATEVIIDERKLLCGQGQTSNQKISVVVGVASHLQSNRRFSPNLFVKVKFHMKFIQDTMSEFSSREENCQGGASTRQSNVIVLSD